MESDMIISNHQDNTYMYVCHKFTIKIQDGSYNIIWDGKWHDILGIIKNSKFVYRILHLCTEYYMYIPNGEVTCTFACSGYIGH